MDKSLDEYCNLARRRLLEQKYKMFEEAALWADANRASDHEKHVLKTFCEMFSNQMHETIGNIDNNIEDPGVKQQLLVSVGTLISFSNSLGNLTRKSAFERMRQATRLAAARAARSVTPDTVRQRREKLRPFVEKVLAENPNYDATKVLKAIRGLAPVDRPAELWQVERTQRKADIEAIVEELQEPKSCPA